jgi:hypothetical protein
MRAFLDVFFARHFLQVQNSLVKYLASEDGLSSLGEGHLRILDIGSGPAVASLAITEVVAHIAGDLVSSSAWHGNKQIQVTYVLNDTESICLGLAQAMLDYYFKMGGDHKKWITHARTLTSQRPFPDNMNQLRRIAGNIGGYDIAVLSYVVTPLKKDAGLYALARGLSDVESLCSDKGRVLILQDRFRAPLMKNIAALIRRSSRKKELTQRAGHTKHENDTYTYSYYTCLYSPGRDEALRMRSIA